MNEQFLLATFFDYRCDETRAYIYYKNGIYLSARLQDETRIKPYKNRAEQLNIKHHEDTNQQKCGIHKEKHAFFQFCYGCRKWFCSLCFPRKCKICDSHVHTNCFYHNDAHKDECGIHYTLRRQFDDELKIFQKSFFDKANEVLLEANTYESTYEFIKASYYYVLAIDWFILSSTLEEEKRLAICKKITDCKVRLQIINRN